MGTHEHEVPTSTVRTADPADVAEQHVPVLGDDAESPADAALPWTAESDPADVAEQRREVGLDEDREHD